MDNQEALELLDVFSETCSRASAAAVWAMAFVQEGGEPTWDAVKSVSDIAITVQHHAGMVEMLRDQYEEILP